MWGPQHPDGLIGNVEGEAVAWCTKPGHGTRLIPAGAITGLQYVQTPDYVQGLYFLSFILAIAPRCPRWPCWLGCVPTLFAVKLPKLPSTVSQERVKRLACFKRHLALALVILNCNFFLSTPFSYSNKRSMNPRLILLL